ncbi:MAG: hypothetical protein ACTSXA_10145, partial [Candidatus Heimdallarchaeota archaeon]
IRTQTEESKQELVRFIISIVLSFLGMGILAMLILFIPNSAMTFESINGELPLTDSNFFYSWSYSVWGPFGSNYAYDVETFLPTTEYLIFSSLAVLLLLIGNSGVLLQNKKRMKVLTFISWGFISITVVAFIIKLVLMRYLGDSYIPSEVTNVLSNLCFYPLFYLPLQIVLLSQKKTLIEFFGLEKRNQDIERKDVIGRRINAIFTLIVYLSTIVLFLKSLFYQDDNYFDVNSLVYAILFSVLAIWFLVNIGVYLNNFRNHKSISFFGFFAGIVIITITMMLIGAVNSVVILDMLGGAYYSIDSLKTPIVILFLTALILISSMPIGFFGRNLKETAVFASVIAVVNFSYNLLVALNSLSLNYISIGVKVLAFSLVPFYVLMVYAGTFWGRFLAKKIISEQAELEENRIEEQVKNA